ncbi:MAG: hypothetical protein J3K34DRAFT_402593, partial [Monoraphidium minutum]
PPPPPAGPHGPIKPALPWTARPIKGPCSCFFRVLRVAAALQPLQPLSLPPALLAAAAAQAPLQPTMSACPRNHPASWGPPFLALPTSLRRRVAAQRRAPAWPASPPVFSVCSCPLVGRKVRHHSCFRPVLIFRIQRMRATPPQQGVPGQFPCHQPGGTPPPRQSQGLCRGAATS